MEFFFTRRCGGGRVFYCPKISTDFFWFSSCFGGLKMRVLLMVKNIMILALIIQDRPLSLFYQSHKKEKDMKSAFALKEALQNRIYVMISELPTSKSGAYHLSPEIKQALKTALALGEIVRVESPYTSNIDSLHAIDAASVIFLDLEWMAIPQSKAASVKFRFKYN